MSEPKCLMNGRNYEFRRGRSSLNPDNNDTVDRTLQYFFPPCFQEEGIGTEYHELRCHVTTRNNHLCLPERRLITAPNAGVFSL
jgi:hypothetical protein